MAKADKNMLTQNMTGALGKEIVYKTVNGKTIGTKYPDRSTVKLTVSQRSCQNIFREVVDFAKNIMADEVLLKEWKKKFKDRKSTRGFSVYHAAIQDYMKPNA